MLFMHNQTLRMSVCQASAKHSHRPALCLMVRSVTVFYLRLYRQYEDAVLPSFKPSALLEVVFFDQAAGASINVTPGMNLTMERK